ncbi:MAG TPA: nuclear transport factor 2 family protein [Acidimicrobiales bacterium]|nr:nuclear transport factor 2 family protein [Acidimicrobiales bacterium]
MALLKRKRSGLTDPMSVVTRFVNACNRHDADSVAACLHPDFDSIQPMYPARNFRGADQVRRNWQAIFDAEPGFRLTVLRQAAADDAVWLELHGAGRDDEVAGIFVMGVQGDRIRWARIYSALIEPMPEGMVDPVPSSPATLRQVPPLDEPADRGAAAHEPTGAAAAQAVVDEDLIAPVLDIDGGGSSRRRRSRRRSHEGDAEPAAAAEDGIAEDVAAADGIAEDVAAGDGIAEEGIAGEQAAAADEPASAEWAPAAEPVEAAAEPQPVAETLVEPAAAEPAERKPVAAWTEPLIQADARPEAHAAVVEPATTTLVEPPDAGPEPAAVEVGAPAAVDPGHGSGTAAAAAAAAALLEEREPEVVAPPEAEPAVVVEAVSVPAAAAAVEEDADDIVWGDLTAEAPDDSDVEADPEPTATIDRAGVLGRPGKRRGRKRR